MHSTLGSQINESLISNQSSFWKDRREPLLRVSSFINCAAKVFRRYSQTKKTDDTSSLRPSQSQFIKEIWPGIPGSKGLDFLSGNLKKTDPEGERPGKLTVVQLEFDSQTRNMDQGTGQLSRRSQETSLLNSWTPKTYKFRPYRVETLFYTSIPGN